MPYEKTLLSSFYVYSGEQLLILKRPATFREA